MFVSDVRFQCRWKRCIGEFPDQYDLHDSSFYLNSGDLVDNFDLSARGCRPRRMHLSEELLLGKFLAGNVCSKENPIALLTSPMNIIK